VEIDEDGWHIVHVPDLGQYTQGEDLVDALFMAEDLISLTCLTYTEKKIELPEPTPLYKLSQSDGVINTLIRADIDAYKIKLDKSAVRKNLTIPNWLNEKAEKAQINFSQVLQEALKEILQVEEYHPINHQGKKT